MIDIKYNEFPPNYEQIKARFDLTGTKPLFTYGKIVYNPHNAQMRPDLLVHEEIHVKQQGDNPVEWWEKYLTDDEFRLSQELDAYSVQFGFVKNLKGMSSKKIAWFLEQLATTLSSPMYGNLLTYNQAQIKIKRKQKELATKK
jgi:hypothetical protein